MKNVEVKDGVTMHYALFVKSVYILLQTSITHSELDQCEIDLLKFVAEFESLYGAISM